MSAEATWEQLRCQSERPIFRRVDDAHPYDVYLGIDPSDAPVLMLLSANPAREVPQLKALEVSQNLRQDGKYALLVTLANPELLHPFRYVCDDLVESLRGHMHVGSEATFMLHRLEKWRRLLAIGKQGLSQDELHGLVGELLFLERLIPVIGSAAALQAWLGPSGAPQDFQNGGNIYEIKTCGVGGHVIAISSLEQLNTGSTTANLIVYSVGSAATGSEDAFTPKQLISRIRELLEQATAVSNFELKLVEVGYDEKQSEVEDPIVVPHVRAFTISEGFPRLIPCGLSPAITSAKYCLDIDKCKQFEIPLSRVAGL